MDIVIIVGGVDKVEKQGQVNFSPHMCKLFYLEASIYGESMKRISGKFVDKTGISSGRKKMSLLNSPYIRRFFWLPLYVVSDKSGFSR